MIPVLSIVIPVFNKYAFTKACLTDLSKLPEDHQIIIVDNGSTDETRAELKKTWHQLLSTTKQLGVCQGLQHWL